jgi:hypothetical protein
VIIPRLIVLLAFAAVALHAGQVFAEVAFPAPLPDQDAAPTSDASPPVNGAAPKASIGGVVAPSSSNGVAPHDACMKGFVPLREEAEKRGKLIKAASERHAQPDEACRLIGSFGQSEIKIIKYVEANLATCGIPPQIADQLRASHKNTEAMQQKVCAVAQQAKGVPVGDSWHASRREPAGPVGDFDHLVPSR